MITPDMFFGFAVEIGKSYASTVIDGKAPTPQEVVQYIKELHEGFLKTYLSKA